MTKHYKGRNPAGSWAQGAGRVHKAHACPEGDRRAYANAIPGCSAEGVNALKLMGAKMWVASVSKRPAKDFGCLNHTRNYEVTDMGGCNPSILQAFPENDTKNQRFNRLSSISKISNDHDV